MPFHIMTIHIMIEMLAKFAAAVVVWVVVVWVVASCMCVSVPHGLTADEQ